MAKYTVNDKAVARARRMIDARQYVVRSTWGDVQPTAEDENASSRSTRGTTTASWHLGLTEGANDETKARHAFVFGDLRRVHRCALIACVYRAAEWDHKEVELAAHDLLQHLDAKRARPPSTVTRSCNEPRPAGDGPAWREARWSSGILGPRRCIRINNRYDVRVLEPSPPAVNEGPWFADDPVAGGELVPVGRRAGARTWDDFCAEIGNAELRTWCEYRWLVPRRLDALPPKFAETRDALHRVAEHVIAPRRHLANGKIGLRYTYRGFGTPFFDDDHQVRVEDGELVDRNRRRPLTTLAAAAELRGRRAGQGHRRLHPDHARASPTPPSPSTSTPPGPWATGSASSPPSSSSSGRRRAPTTRRPGSSCGPSTSTSPSTSAPTADRANFGGSPGDAEHPEPYLYVGPWDRRPREGDFWNEPFGASLSHSAIREGADPLDFLRQGKVLVTA